jgi:Firmicute plasmid replication protein (RepL)
MKKQLNKKQAENISESIQRELNEDMQVSIVIRSKIPTIPDYVQLFQEAIRRIVAGDNMTLITYRVFCFMLGTMQFQNFLGINIKTMAEDLNVSEPSIKRAMKQLKELNIIISIKDTMDRRLNCYMLNPKAAWKGKAKNYIETVKKMKNLQDPGQHKIEFPTE